MDKSFKLYDLKIEVHQQEGKPMVCNHPKGSYFILSGENIIFPEGVTFPIYSFAALIPILPAKQRETAKYDWMSTDHYIACPDPQCGGLFKIIRLPQKRAFMHNEVTKVKFSNDIPKVINGCWQLSAGHKENAKEYDNDLLLRYVQAGFNTFDCADIYTGVEERLGEFKKFAQERGCDVRIHTKFVPDLDSLTSLSEVQITNTIKRSCTRLQVDSLDLVQFHWWNYNAGDYLEALKVLQTLKQHGLIQGVGLTNFNTEHLKRIVESKTVEIESIQIQYSLLDKRPEKSLIEYAKSHNIKILCYGTLAGGFLTEKWLGKVQPNTLENRSLIKYQLIIDEFGGWKKFQSLLSVLVNIASKYKLSTAELITLYMLRYTDANSIILGINNDFHRNILHLLESFSLVGEELEMINEYSAASLSGDVYDLERDFDTKHAHIMRYNINKGKV